MKVEHLFIYPVKSLGGIEVNLAHLSERGFRYDRRYMLVDEKGTFITRRTFPKMALFSTSIEEHGFRIEFFGDKPQDSVVIPFEPLDDNLRRVKIWDDECFANVLSQELNDYFSERLEQKCSLVYMPSKSNRPVDPRYAKNEEITSFADAFPLLLIGSASLDDLNNQLAPEHRVGWDRFRPNIVVRTSIPFEEDTWRNFRIGESGFEAVKPCARCVMVTVNTKTGKAGKEPLKTLAAYRTTNNKVMFGQNVLIQSHKGVVVKGDSVVVM